MSMQADDAVEVSPLGRATMTQSVHLRLVRMIRSGALALGQRLDEASLAERLGVSRTPIREAIRRLASEGIAEHRPYQGHFIRTFSVKQVNDIFEYRKVLEGLALRQVAAADGVDLRPLAEIVEHSARSLAAGERAAFEAADRAFHDWIWRTSGNEMVIQSLHGLELQIQLLRQVANQADDFRDGSQTQREVILAALRAGDGEAASAMMHEHIAGAQAAAVANLQSHLSADGATR